MLCIDVNSTVGCLSRLKASVPIVPTQFHASQPSFPTLPADQDLRPREQAVPLDPAPPCQTLNGSQLGGWLLRSDMVRDSQPLTPSALATMLADKKHMPSPKVSQEGCSAEQAQEDDSLSLDLKLDLNMLVLLPLLHGITWNPKTSMEHRLLSSLENM
ncbi:UNVERIFIED_CONTAM: hypothetical protein FKN15_013879 [Acipenser sinensis]